MGNINKLCEDEQKKINGFEGQYLTTSALNKQILLPPERPKTIENLYRFFTAQKSLAFSIENNKQMYSPLRYSIFGEQGLYVGQTKHYRPHGPGQFYFNNGNFLEAVFEEGQIECQDALFIQKNGNHYRGGFKESVQAGVGSMRASGEYYRGRFSRGRLEGPGSLELEDGRKYTGNFKRGKIEGKGKLLEKNGDVYQGYFKQGRRSGIGRMSTEQYEYVGPFEDDMKEGKGTLFFKNGLKFQGWFEKDQVCGYGEIHRPHGHVEKKVYKPTSIAHFFN